MREGICRMNKDVTKADMQGVLDLVHASLSCHTHEDFYPLIRQFQNLVAFDHMFCNCGDLIGILKGKKGAACNTLVSPGYPMKWRERYMQKSYFLGDCVCRAFFDSFELQNWQMVRDRYDKGEPSIVQLEAATFGIRDGYSHGTQNRDMTRIAVITIAAGKMDYTPRTEYILLYAIPHLTQCLFRIHGEKPKRSYPLTNREMEVLKWLKEGKTRWEIAHILSISHRTVSFHVNNIFKKLDVVNSSQAVAVALENRVL